MSHQDKLEYIVCGKSNVTRQLHSCFKVDGVPRRTTHVKKNICAKIHDDSLVFFFLCACRVHKKMSAGGVDAQRTGPSLTHRFCLFLSSKNVEQSTIPEW